MAAAFSASFFPPPPEMAATLNFSDWIASLHFPYSIPSLSPSHRSPVLCSAPPANFNSDWRSATVPRWFPPFLPKEVEKIKDYHAIKLAKRIERIPVPVPGSESCVMSSCVRPLIHGKSDPVVLLHGFDSSCLEWRYVHPLLQNAGLESWANDIIGWGFSDVEKVTSYDVVSKRDHLYAHWRTYIKRPMVRVGPSLGGAVAIDFAMNHPEVVRNHANQTKGHRDIILLRENLNPVESIITYC